LKDFEDVNMEKIDDKHMQGVSPENRLGQIDRAKIYRQTSFI